MVAAALTATAEQRADLERMAASTSLPHRQVIQARALLWACEGIANDEIGRLVGGWIKSMASSPMGEAH